MGDLDWLWWFLGAMAVCGVVSFARGYWSGAKPHLPEIRAELRAIRTERADRRTVKRIERMKRDG